MELGLKGKVALVTGSSRGIGRGVALALAAEGCDVMLTGRDAAALDEVADAIRKSGRRAGVAVLDLREKGAVGEADRPGASASSAGSIFWSTMPAPPSAAISLTLTDADFEDGYALKFFAHVRLARAAWPLLKERRGSLVSIGGTGGRKPTAEFTIGASVNAAVAAFSKCLADRGKEEGVQVNCIHPSMVETDRLWRRIKAEMERTGWPEDKARKEMCRGFGITRFGTVEDVADLVTFIVSSRATWLHGATIDLDGGEIPTL